VTYPVRVVLDEGNLVVSISEVREWLNEHEIDTSAFQYRMSAGHVELRIDFISLSDASTFAGAFGGWILGIKKDAPAEVDDAEGEPPEAA
jgi:hypothetical protein